MEKKNLSPSVSCNFLLEATLCCNALSLLPVQNISRNKYYLSKIANSASSSCAKYLYKQMLLFQHFKIIFAFMARLHLFVIITTIDIYIIYFMFNWTPVQIFATFAFCNRIEGCVGGLIGGCPKAYYYFQN